MRMNKEKRFNWKIFNWLRRFIGEKYNRDVSKSAALVPDKHNPDKPDPDKIISDKNNSENIPKKRRVSKLVVWLMIIAIILIITFLILFRLNFMIGEQLRITLTPEYYEINTTGSSVVPFAVDIKLYNNFECEAECNYTLTDMSHDTILDKGSFSSKTYKNKAYSFDIPMNYLGYGINTYLYRLECHNLYTPLCPANSDAIVRKSLLVVQYAPSVEQLSAADFSKNSYALATNNVINASHLMSNAGNIIDAVPILFDKARYALLKSDMNTIANDLQGVLSLWRNDDYVSAKAFIVNNNILNNSESLISNVSSYNDYIIATINDHNVLLELLTYERSKLQLYKEILSYNLLNLSPSLNTSIIKTIIDGNSAINSFNGNQYDYTLLSNKVSSLDAISSGLDDALINSTKSKLIDIYPALYIYTNMICMMDNASANGGNAAGTDISNISVLCDRNYGLNANNNPNVDLNTVDDVSTKLYTVCSDASLIISRLQISMNMSMSMPDSEDTLLMQYKLLSEYELVNGQNSILSYNTVLPYYKAYVADALVNTYNVTTPEDLILKYNFNSSLFYFNADNAILSDLRAIEKLCNESAKVPAINDVTAQYYAIPVFNDSNITDAIDISASLPEPVMQCCLYGNCQSCEKTPSKNPLILLHGHSFNVKTDAYQSIEIFDGFEEKFSNDKDYFETGTLLNTGNSTSDILGHYYLPLMSRPTYYIETYNDLLGLTVSQSKTDNIDSYALRLKESIDYTIYITGSSKVDIVAHSMGGLVLRRYMQIFGTASIGKVILIATPSQGISDRTYNLCKIFGSSTECEDMRMDALFIKKLNDLSTSQNLNDTYLVVGKGCDTDGQDGDGIVTVNNSMIPGIPQSHVFYVTGKCSGTDLLHNDLLDINKYPEVYNYVKKILG